MIEIAPRSSKFTYEEAILYCQFLEHNEYKDWRMPTLEEYNQNLTIYGWYVNRPQAARWCVYPVRDI